MTQIKFKLFKNLVVGDSVETKDGRVALITSSPTRGMIRGYLSVDHIVEGVGCWSEAHPETKVVLACEC